MTSPDRHASHDSPYRTGQHMPLNQSRHAPLTSVATSAMDSRHDLSLPSPEDNARSSSPTQDGRAGSPGQVQSSSVPYSPGMRTSSALGGRKHSQDNNPFEAGEIQMQSFEEGLPPPPPVTHSWRRIERWVEEYYEELHDQLSEGCTQNDINELEHELDCSLPMEVRESLQCHDGQERGGRPTGIIFGCMLLDCEEIVQEWRNWRTVNEEFLSAPPRDPQVPPKAPGAASSSGSVPRVRNPLWRQELLERQDSQPPRAIAKAYAHPGWIPLARDWGGNNIAVDLAPGPAGKWGQVIIFGRDYDCKYVVARSWAAFLATVADDFGSDKVFVDEDTQELKLREFKRQNVEPPYLEILRWRTDQKYGRRPPKRRSPNGLGPRNDSTGSPYGHPVGERGRSPQRLSGRNPDASPRGNPAKSPLSQVSEEAAAAPPNLDTSLAGTKSGGEPKAEKLIEVPTPMVADDETRQKTMSALLMTDDEHDKENKRAEVAGLGVGGLDGEMKSVAI
jgi:cell wall assembly regulator SMI1